jgi:hypothetical protein
MLELEFWGLSLQGIAKHAGCLGQSAAAIHAGCLNRGAELLEMMNGICIFWRPRQRGQRDFVSTSDPAEEVVGADLAS